MSERKAARRSGGMQNVGDMSEMARMPKSPMEVSNPPVPPLALRSLRGEQDSRPGAETSDATRTIGSASRYLMGSDLPDEGGPTIISQTGGESGRRFAANAPTMA